MAEFSLADASASNSKTRATLLARLHNGSDAYAWEEFFQRYWLLIYVYARRCNCSEHTAEEVVQDVMLKVFEQKELFHYDPARGRFRDWLGAVVWHKVAEFRRRPSERVRAKGGDPQTGCIEPLSSDAKPEEVWENTFEESLLLVLLDVVRDEMSPREYLAFELSTLHQMPGAKVARQTGLRRDSVYRACRRALKRLKEMGAKYSDDGQLSEKIKLAMQSRPRAAVEQSLTTRVEKAMQLK